MKIDNIQDLVNILRSKPGYFDNMLEDKFSIKLDDLTPDNVTWGSIGMDDLDSVEMIMEFEKYFDIEIPDDLMNSIEDTNFYEFYSKVSIARIREDKLNELGIVSDEIDKK
jgi:acyl carrier protein